MSITMLQAALLSPPRLLPQQVLLLVFPPARYAEYTSCLVSSQMWVSVRCPYVLPDPFPLRGRAYGIQPPFLATALACENDMREMSAPTCTPELC